MFSATDIANFLACRHIATLDRAEERKEVTKPFFADPTVDLLRKLGLEHEQRYLRQLAETDGLTVVQIDVNGPWEAAVSETVQAIRRGEDAIYQATFLDGPWGGRSDLDQGPRFRASCELSLYNLVRPCPEGAGFVDADKEVHPSPRQD